MLYSPLKIFHHRDALDSLRKGEHVAPIRIQLVPTNRCNQNCRGCAYRMAGYTSAETFNSADELPWSKLREIVDDCQAMGIRAIEVTGGGEPAIHPQFADLCGHIVNAGLDLGVVTNGSVWDDRILDGLRDAHWVRFSIDAGTESTYIRYRRTGVGVYQQVRDHLRQLTSAEPPRRPVVGVGFVVNAMNWQEVIIAAENAKADGADNFRISALFQSAGPEYFKDFYEDAREMCREAALLAMPDFTVFNLFGERLEELFAGQPGYSYCGYSKLTTYLGADQKAYVCCINAYNPQGIIGEFSQQSFRQMWESEETKNAVQGLDARNCPRCIYNSRNQAIAYAIADNPPHVNFI
ncbi:MAG: radical SAM protein [Minisyncoccia bacterium]